MKCTESLFRKLVIAPLLLWILLSGSAFAKDKPHPAEAFYQKGLQLSQQLDWTSATGEFQKAVELKPDHKLAHANLGVALSQLGHHKLALLAFEKALALGYDTAALRYNRGASFARLNLLSEAESEYKAALTLNPRLVRADYELGVIYLLQNRRDEVLDQVNILYRRNRKLAQQLHSQAPPGYKIMSISDGGTLKGQVTMIGETPRVRAFNLIHSPNIEFCTRMSDGKGHRLLRDYVVSPEGGLQDTVVSIRAVPKGKPFASKMQTFHIERCHSDKYAIGIRNGEDLLVENTDPINHEIATYEFAGKNITQLAYKTVLPHSTQIRDAFVREDVEEFTIKCNLHPFLQTHGFIVDNPYYAVTDKDGRFSIENIPPGTYEVIAWHTYSPTQRATITINSNSESSVEFTFDAKEVRRKLYQDDIKGYRFNTMYDSPVTYQGDIRVDDPIEILQDFSEAEERYLSDSGPGLIRAVPAPGSEIVE
jgi:tetratricopeptide (TPR) repeat protein